MRKCIFLLLCLSCCLFSCKKGNDGGMKITDGNYPYFMAKEAGSVISMVSETGATGRIGYSVSLQYQVNGTSDGYWLDFIADVTMVTLNNAGDKVYFRANEDNSKIGYYPGSCYKFTTNDKKVDVGGNILYLLSKTPTTEQMGLRSFECIFRGCNIVDASRLVLPNNARIGCYAHMFDNCTYLAKAPALPATALSSECYSCMFANCTSLTTAPALPATALSSECYSCMFANCTSLTTAPALPATTLAPSCYHNMFKDCTSLTTAPALPATALAQYCYHNMFKDCTSLTTAPVLPATSIFSSCYEEMFKGCSKLKSVKMKATTIGSSSLSEGYSLYGWLKDAGTSTSSPELIVDGAITTSHEAWSEINDNTPNNWSIKTEDGVVLR